MDRILGEPACEHAGGDAALPCIHHIDVAHLCHLSMEMGEAFCADCLRGRLHELSEAGLTDGMCVRAASKRRDVSALWGFILNSPQPANLSFWQKRLTAPCGTS